MYILRDVLQYSNSLDEARNAITNANRTCNLILGVGDGKAEHVNGNFLATYYNTLHLKLKL